MVNPFFQPEKIRFFRLGTGKFEIKRKKTLLGKKQVNKTFDKIKKSYEPIKKQLVKQKDFFLKNMKLQQKEIGLSSLTFAEILVFQLPHKKISTTQ